MGLGAQRLDELFEMNALAIPRRDAMMEQNLHCFENLVAELANACRPAPSIYPAANSPKEIARCSPLWSVAQPE